MEETRSMSSSELSNTTPLNASVPAVPEPPPPPVQVAHEA
jgi:hypothetical protein